MCGTQEEKRMDTLEKRIEALEGIKTTPCLQSDFNYYVVLGFKLQPVDPNDYGFVNESDNPILLNTYEFAEQVANKVTEKLKEDAGAEFRAEIAGVRILTVCGH